MEELTPLNLLSLCMENAVFSLHSFMLIIGYSIDINSPPGLII